MSRFNRARRARNAHRAVVEADAAECGETPPRWFVAVYLSGGFAICSAFASAAVFIGVVQPLLAPLLYRSTDGTIVGYAPSLQWDGEWGLGANCALVSYTVDGQTYRCVGSLYVEVPSRGSLRVYYPADRPDRGFVCDWGEERRWRVITWPVAAFALPVLLFMLVWYWLSAVPQGGRTAQSLTAVVGLPLALWFGGLFLGGAVGMLLVSDPKDMDHTGHTMLLQVVGGLVGGLWGLRCVGARAGGGQMR